MVTQIFTAQNINWYFIAKRFKKDSNVELRQKNHVVSISFHILCQVLNI